MKFEKKEYYEIDLGNNMGIHYDNGSGTFERKGQLGSIYFKKEEIEDLMIGFNWLYHEVVESKSKP